MDFFSHRKAIITAGSDSLIKIWTYRKILVIQLSLEEKIEAAFNVNMQNDLLIMYEGQVTYIKFRNFEFSDEEIKKMNQSCKENRQNVEISLYFVYKK